MKLSKAPLMSALVIVLVGCAETREQRAERYQHEDEATLAKLEALRLATARTGGAPRETIQYAEEVMALLSGKDRKAVKRGALLHVPYAHELIAVAVKAAPDEAPTLIVTDGYLYEVTGQTAEAMASYERSFAMHPRRSNMLMLTSRYDLQGRWHDVTALCAKGRPAIDSTELFAVLDACLYHSHATTVATGLAWASDDDRAMYVGELKRQEADAERRRAQREAREIAILQAQITASAINRAAATTATATREAAETTAAATREAARYARTQECITTKVGNQLSTVCD